MGQGRLLDKPNRKGRPIPSAARCALAAAFLESASLLGPQGRRRLWLGRIGSRIGRTLHIRRYRGLSLGLRQGSFPSCRERAGVGISQYACAPPETLFLMATELRKPRHSRIDTDVPWHERPDTFPKGRRCSLCGHTLSVYNPASKCFHHGGPRLVRGWKDETEALEDLRELAEEAA